MRTSEITRKTNETDITLRLDLDGKGISHIDTGVGFFDHMLTLLAKHARFDLEVHVNGDLKVDGHHTIEDIGIVLGQALREAMGSARGITRYGSIILPMDETLVLCAIDISGRAHLSFDAELGAEHIGTMDAQLVREFFEAFVRRAELTLHIRKLAGLNAHHIAECCFKAFARALSAAVKLDGTDEIPSTKGVL
ncbi:MAG: imidazoleglycerol-phosphate dehydratase HisB [Oscillospiraceae bacterium]|jgi:imidazoleglycerol-phosphate dehydratase|nr:imidazoleglycerol-phosphate dehydratase HisB [Oscillospiraceae bacterium]